MKELSMMSLHLNGATTLGLDAEGKVWLMVVGRGWERQPMVELQRVPDNAGPLTKTVRWPVQEEPTEEKKEAGKRARPPA